VGKFKEKTKTKQIVRSLSRKRSFKQIEKPCKKSDDWIKCPITLPQENNCRVRRQGDLTMFRTVNMRYDTKNLFVYMIINTLRDWAFHVIKAVVLHPEIKLFAVI